MPQAAVTGVIAVDESQEAIPGVKSRITSNGAP
jgi:hypothetical protein